MSQERTAKALGIHPTTLRQHYRAELDAAAGVWEADFELALGQRLLDPKCEATLMKFGANVRLGWREIAPKDPDRKSLDDLNDDQLSALIAERARERRSRDRGGAGDPEEETRAA